MSAQLDTLRRYVGARAITPLEGGGRVLLVGSGKGGVGTSTVAALIGITAAAAGLEVLLVDADANIGSLPLLLGLRAGDGLGALRGGAASPEALLIPVGETLTLLPIGGAPADAEISAAERRALLRRLDTVYHRFDLVVVDAGSRLDSVLAVCGAGVDRILAVTSTDRISAAATFALVKVVDARFAAVPIEVLVNRHEGPAALGTFAEVRAGAQEFLGREIGFAGAVPHDESLRAGVEAGMAVQEAAVGSPAAVACQQIGLRVGREMIEVKPAVVATRSPHWR